MTSAWVLVPPIHANDDPGTITSEVQSVSRVVLAMSGGVDSSVAAQLLLQQGHEVIGVFMRHGEQAIQACSTDGSRERSPLLPLYESHKGHKQGCCSASDAEDARRVADHLNIPFYALNLQAEFGRIVQYFIEEYTRGRTPNPCVVCNHWIKFGKLFDYADSVGAQYVATGHYARLTSEPGEDAPALRRGIDGTKDQSYVLFGIDRGLLRRMLLPVGEYRKTRIRELASRLGLRVADKRDSQEICFVPPGEHAEFVRARSEMDTSGELVTTDGRVVGRHPGIEGFTIGQRRGLGVALGERAFVVRIEPQTRRVVIGSHDELGRCELSAIHWNWLVPPPAGPFRCRAKIRYNSPPADATVEWESADRARVIFEEPRHGVAAGQAVVCYDQDRVLGGGWIE